MTGQTFALPASTATRSRIRSVPLLAIGGVGSWLGGRAPWLYGAGRRDSSVSWGGTFG
jgi:hypothetical protein